MLNPPAIDSQAQVSDLRVYLPAEALRPLVASYYFLETDGPLVDFIRPGSANIRFALDGV